MGVLSYLCPSRAGNRRRGLRVVISGFRDFGILPSAVWIKVPALRDVPAR